MQGARKRLKQGVDHISAVMDLYDRFKNLRENFTETTNWMLLISLGTFVATLMYSLHFLVNMTTGYLRMGILALVFIGISAAVFSIVRGILYYVQSSIEHSRQSLNMIKEAGTIPGELPGRSIGRTIVLIENSLHHWWNARRLTVRIILMLIPGFLFFVLGIASLLAIVIGLIVS